MAEEPSLLEVDRVVAGEGGAVSLSSETVSFSALC